METDRTEGAGPPASAGVGAALAARRKKSNLTRREVALRSRILEPDLAEIEAGRRPPTPKELVRLARLLGTTPGRLLAEGEYSAAVERAPDDRSLDLALGSLRWEQAFRSALLEHVRARSLPAARPCSAEAGPERRLAEESWVSLQPLSPAVRKAAIGGDPILAYPHYKRWGLAERLCMECEASLPGDPRRALGLAELALHVAERVGGAPAWRRHLQGYTWAFIAKAKLAAGDRAGAEGAVARGRELWNPGCLEEPDFLGWPEMPGLGASR